MTLVSCQVSASAMGVAPEFYPEHPTKDPRTPRLFNDHPPALAKVEEQREK
jgi:hypothetical protein